MDFIQSTVQALLVMFMLSDPTAGVSQQVITQELNDHLFTNYSRSLIPICQVGQNVTLSMDIALRQIIALNEREQILSTNVWLRLRWNDCRLTWDPASYNVTYIMKTYADVWVPDITLYDSSAEEVMFPGREDYRTYISHTGSVTYNFPTVLNSVCRVDVTYFPLDTQRCQLQFGSWSHHGFELDIYNRNPQGDLDNFIGNSEWEVNEFPIERHVLYYNCCPEPYPDVTFYVVMKRRPTFYILTMVFPCILTSTVAAFTFLLPVESGEKVSLEITVLLSLAVFMLLVSESMPPSSDNFPIVGTYFAVSMVMVSLSLLQTIIVLNMFYRGTNGRRVPHWMRVLFLQYIGRVVFVRTNRVQDAGRDATIETKIECLTEDHIVQETHIIDHKKHDPIMEIDRTDSESEIGGKNGIHRPVGGILPSLAFQREPTLETHMQNQTKHLKNIDSHFERKHSESRHNAEWRDLSNVMDRLCFILYSVVTLILTLAFLLQCVVQ